MALAIVVFATTNFDDIFVLLGFFADSRIHWRNVVCGQYIGIGTLVAASVAASLISLFLPPPFVGLLGVLPIVIGIKRLFDLRRDPKTETQADETERRGAFAQIASVAVVTVANGGDNLGVYTPLFATQSASEITVTVIVFVVMTALWVSVGRVLVSHRTLGAPIRRYLAISWMVLIILLFTKS